MNTNIEELASLYVLDKLSAEERQSFVELLENDTELILLVRELEAALEGQVRDLPQHPAPQGLFQRIQSRLKSEIPEATPRSVVSLPLSVFIGWGMAAALLLGIGLTLFVPSRDGLDSGVSSQSFVLVVGMDSQSSVVKTVPLVVPVDEIDNFVHLAQMAETYWQHPEQLPVRVDESPLVGTLGSGYAVYDPNNKQGFIAIHKLPKRERGKNYFLWLKDANVLECAGIIPMQEQDQGMYFFELEDSSPISSTLVSFFITEEDTADAELSQPSGELVLGSDHI
ncbi:MAG: hypothetical protein CMI18_14365 [Opitutaceae bacterium]|nr:hypothetical protein [Opitutaceae bacterium]|tara:strand:- start:519 stop:1364 length:846 start_codon:yes stop_codon:yes gene_type:complete